METGQLQGDAGERRCQEVVQQDSNGFGDKEEWLLEPYPSLASYIQGFSNMAESMENDESGAAAQSEADRHPASLSVFAGELTSLGEEEARDARNCPICHQTLDPCQITWEACRSSLTGCSIRSSELRRGMQNGCRVCRMLRLGILGFVRASNPKGQGHLKAFDSHQIRLFPSDWGAFTIKLASQRDSDSRNSSMDLDIFTRRGMLMPVIMMPIDKSCEQNSRKCPDLAVQSIFLQRSPSNMLQMLHVDGLLAARRPT
jgi:hypothetical protein